VRVTSSKLITKDGSHDPKAVVTFYEDFLCPACGNFEREYGPTVSKLIDSGAIAADYYMVGLLSRPQNDDYSSRAANAAYCVADESIDAFRRFHTTLYRSNLQPSETGTTFPSDAQLIEYARVAGVVGKVPDCVNSGKYLPKPPGFTPPRQSASTARTTNGRRLRRWWTRSKRSSGMSRASTRLRPQRRRDRRGVSANWRAS
jgi:protein-disulfide isomerase